MHSAHNNDYYCTLSVPLINHSTNVQKGDLYPVGRPLGDETLIVGGAGERDWERIRFLSGSPAAEEMKLRKLLSRIRLRKGPI